MIDSAFASAADFHATMLRQRERDVELV